MKKSDLWYIALGAIGGMIMSKHNEKENAKIKKETDEIVEKATSELMEKVNEDSRKRAEEAFTKYHL